jgi:hypothetical protein
LRRCVYQSVLFFHRERTARRYLAFATVQEHFWERFEQQSFAVSQNYPHPGDRARDMRAGEGVLEKYVAEADKDADIEGTNIALHAKIPGAKLPLLVAVDMLRSDTGKMQRRRLKSPSTAPLDILCPVPVAVRVVPALPDEAVALFRLAPWAAAVASAIRAKYGCNPKRMEAMFLVVNESPQVVRLELPVPPPETLVKLRLWLRAFTCGLARGEVYPQPGEHCAECQFRAPCAYWPHLPKE